MLCALSRNPLMKLRWRVQYNLGTVRQRCRVVPGDVFYAAMEAHGIAYGSAFRGVVEVWNGSHEVLAKVCTPSELEFSTKFYCVHPALLDSVLQVMGALNVGESSPTSDKIVLPVGMGSCRVFQRPGSELWSHGITSISAVQNKSPSSQGCVVCDVFTYDAAGQPVVEIRDFSVQRLEEEVGRTVEESLEECLYKIEWQKVSPCPATVITQSSAVVGRGSSKHGWIMLTDNQDVGATLQLGLENRGETCFVVSVGQRFTQRLPGMFEVNPDNSEDLQRVFEALERNESVSIRGIVHLWSLDGASIAQGNTDSNREAFASQLVCCNSIAQLIQGLVAGSTAMPRLWIITREVHVIEAEDRAMGFTQSPVWGVGRAVSHEHPELRCTVVDLGSGNRIELNNLVSLLDADVQHSQMALRGGTTYAAALRRARLSRKARTSSMKTLARVTVIDGLHLSRSRSVWKSRNLASWTT